MSRSNRAKLRSTVTSIESADEQTFSANGLKR